MGIESGGDAHQPSNAAGHDAVGAAERGQRQHSPWATAARIGAGTAEPPVTIRDIRSSRAEISGFSRGRPNASSATRSAAARLCNRPGLQRRPLPHPTIVVARLRAPGPPAASPRTPGRRPNSRRGAAPRRRAPRTPGSPQRRLRRGHRPAAQIRPVPVGPTKGIARVFGRFGHPGRSSSGANGSSVHGGSPYPGGVHPTAGQPFGPRCPTVRRTTTRRRRPAV